MFADITESVADRDIAVVGEKLTTSFMQIKQYCESNELTVNASKTQLVIFKTPKRKIPQELKLILDNCEIKPMNSAKLLGVTLDRYFTTGDHIDGVVRKCQGMLGVLRKAAPNLIATRPIETSLRRPGAFQSGVR